MKTMIYQGKRVKLLNQHEKASELNMSVRTLYKHMKQKKLEKHMVVLPDMKRPFFISSCPLDMPRM